MLRIEMLPAERGDCLLIEYGPVDAVEHRVLIDGGHGNAYGDVRRRLLEVPTDELGRRQFESLVITHIDSDHIDGVIALLQDPKLNCWFNDIWFNGWRHLRPLTEDGEAPSPKTLGPKQGEFLGGLLEYLGQPWNRYFTGGPIFVPDDEPLPALTINGGLSITLLSPTLERLRELRKVWEEVLHASHAEPGLGPQALVTFGRMLTDNSIVTLGDEARRSSLDNKDANGASIAFLAEFQGRRLLLTGDGWADVIRPSLSRWLKEQPDGPERVALDAFKLSHHGSKYNITPQLMEVISCRHYLVSTNGAGNSRHPNVEAMATVEDHHHAAPGQELPVVCFNYDSDTTKLYKNSDRMEARYGEKAVLAWND